MESNVKHCIGITCLHSEGHLHVSLIHTNSPFVQKVNPRPIHVVAHQKRLPHVTVRGDTLLRLCLHMFS